MNPPFAWLIALAFCCLFAPVSAQQTTAEGGGQAQNIPNPIEDIVRARQLHIVDAEGVAKVFLGASDRGGVVHIGNNAGKLRLALQMDELSNPEILMFDDNGELSAHLTQTEKGSSLALLRSGNVLLNISATDSGRMAILSSEGSVLAELANVKGDDGVPFAGALVIKNSEGRVLGRLTGTEDPRGVLDLVGVDQVITVSPPLPGESGSP